MLFFTYCFVHINWTILLCRVWWQVWWSTVRWIISGSSLTASSNCGRLRTSTGTRSLETISLIGPEASGGALAEVDLVPAPLETRGRLPYESAPLSRQLALRKLSLTWGKRSARVASPTADSARCHPFHPHQPKEKSTTRLATWCLC